MGHSKLAGMTGKVDHHKMRQQLRDLVRQGGIMPSDLPEVVIEEEEGEYDNEPGGVRLDGDSPVASPDPHQMKASNLNPSSSPWVPKSTTAQRNNKIEQPEVAELDYTPKMNGIGNGHPGYISMLQNGQNFHVQGNSATANDTHLPLQGFETIPSQALSNSGSIVTASGAPAGNTHLVVHPAVNGSQFVPATTQQNQPLPVNMANYAQQLTGSASMGNLAHHTPVHQGNDGLLYEKGNEVVAHGDFDSSGSDTPKAASHGGLMTEPRNFAPRTSGDLTRLGAPPKFNLNNDRNGTNTLTPNGQDPFVSPITQGGTVRMPVFGSHFDTTHLLVTGHIPFPPPPGEMLTFDGLSRNKDEQPIGNGPQGDQGQVYFGNGEIVTTHGVPAQHVGNRAAFTRMQVTSLHPLAGNSAALVPYQAGYQSQNTVAPYSAPVPDYIRDQRSMELNRITAGPTGLPAVNVAMHQANFPFVEPASRPSNVLVRGVIKIGNIPFVTNRAEIIAVLGRNSRILNDTEEPVHIIMERVTGKTTDAYVEFHTLEDASKAVEKHHQNISRGRVTRIGQRPVEIELSSESALMKDLFPSAKGVFWNGGNPQILPNNDEEPWDNFKGFVSNEEMTMLVKHVEVPHRSPFSKECPQRPFECLISTLTKFPWHMKANVTVQQRHAMHKATCDLLRILVCSIRDKRDEVNLTTRLLKRVVTAAMRCEGFSVAQKDDIAYLVDMSDMEQRAFGQPRFAESWRHLYVLVPKTGVPLDVIEWYVAIIREETSRFLEMQSFQEKCQARTISETTDGYFGYLWRELNHPAGPEFDRKTLSQLAMQEYQTMESIICRALTPTTVG